MYDVVLFDIDGVLLSEEGYFDASALTVYELLTGQNYLGLTISGLSDLSDLSDLPSDVPMVDNTWNSKVRQFVFADDAVLDFMKARGVNANWDMVYLQFGYQFAQVLNDAKVKVGPWLESGRLSRSGMQNLGSHLREQGLANLHWHDFAQRYSHSRDKAELFRQLEDDFKQRAGVEDQNLSTFTKTLWDMGQEAFQDWYLGERYRETETARGKSGFLDNEVPLAQPDELRATLAALQARGVQLGVATGRPSTETYVPLRLLGWLDLFAPDRITTASDVLEAQRSQPEEQPLSKPHPYSYLRSYLHSPEATAVLQHPLPLPADEAGKVLVVGDSVADWMAANAIGFDFAAVLTGLSGQAARAQFESLGCTYIWDTVLDVSKLLEY